MCLLFVNIIIYSRMHMARARPCDLMWRSSMHRARTCITWFWRVRLPRPHEEPAEEAAYDFMRAQIERMRSNIEDTLSTVHQATTIIFVTRHHSRGWRNFCFFLIIYAVIYRIVNKTLLKGVPVTFAQSCYNNVVATLGGDVRTTFRSNIRKSNFSR